MLVQRLSSDRASSFVVAFQNDAATGNAIGQVATETAGRDGAVQLEHSSAGTSIVQVLNLRTLQNVAEDDVDRLQSRVT